MREGPSQALCDFLERTALASTEDLSAAAACAQRLVRGLPLFDSVWVDALAQDHVLTPYQARQINAGHASSLEVGPYVVCRRLTSPALGRVFEARHIETQQRVRLFVANVAQVDCPIIEQRAQMLVEKSRNLAAPLFVGVEQAGVEDTGRRSRFWAASPPIDGTTASEWLIPHGRFSATVVLDIARQMTAGLAELEKSGMLHTDICTANVVLTESGNVVLPMPGLRGIVRPEEGYGHADLAPEAYDTLAVERLVDGTAPTVASELFACGALWWHLLAGRPPMPGGDSIAKLRNVQQSKIPSVRRWVPDVPDVLECAIKRCTHRDPSHRGSSFAELAKQLGSSSCADHVAVGDSVRRHRRPTRHASNPRSAYRHALPKRSGMLAVGLIVALLAAGTWVVTRATSVAPTASIEIPQPVDRDVAPAATPEDIERQARPSNRPLVRDRAEPNVIHFSASDATDGRLPRLRAGATLRGDPRARPILDVPPQGLQITLPHLRFENIDFVRRHAPSPESDETPAMLRVQSGWVEFHQCSFQTADLPFGAPQPVAIATGVRANDGRRSTASDSVRVIVDACVFRGVAAAIDVRSPVSVAIDSDHSLFLGPGPFVRLRFAPVVDRPVSIALSRFTLRGATALFACDDDQLPDAPGKLSITAEHSVLAPQTGGALISLGGAENPEAMLRLAVWNGEGSLLSHDTQIAHWHDPDGRTAPLPESILSMDGITRSRFRFVSPQVHLPESSAIKNVSAPLRGDQPPGIDAQRLRLPVVASREGE